MPRQCIICNEPQSTSFSVFSFPSTIQMREAWIEALKKANPKFSLEQRDRRLKNGICQKHFLSSEMNDGKKKRIKRNTVPSIDLTITERAQKKRILAMNTIVTTPQVRQDINALERPLISSSANKETITLVSNSFHGYSSDDSRVNSNDNLSGEETPMSDFINRSVQTEDKALCIEFNIAENGNWKSSQSLRSICDEYSDDDMNSTLFKGEWQFISCDENPAQCSLCQKVENYRLFRVSREFFENLNSYLLKYLPSFAETYWGNISSLDGDVCINCVNVFEDLYEIFSRLTKKLKILKKLLDDNVDSYNSTLKGNRSQNVSSAQIPKASETKHRMQKRLKSKTFSCSECSEKFLTLAALSKHSETHDNSDSMEKAQKILPSTKIESSSTDSKCHSSKKNSSRQALLEHRKSHNTNSDCPVCGRHLTTKARLKLHLYKFHKIGEPTLKTFHCTLCAKSFSTKSGLTYHEHVHHKKETQYICKICNKTFYYSILFKSHMLYSHGEKTVVCEICGKMFFTVSKLNEHINAVHRNAKSWSCKYCNQKFTTTWAYKSHVSVNHRKVLYSCVHCSASFTRKTHLTFHLWKHGVYFCLSCNNKFDSAESYSTHMLEVHNKDISHRLKNILKAAPIGEIGKSFTIDQSKYLLSCKKPMEINDILMNDVFNNPNLSSATFTNNKLKKRSSLDNEDAKVKALDMIEASQDLSSVDSLNLCNLKDDLKISPEMTPDDRITLGDDVSLLDAQILEDIENFQLKEHDHESESACMNQVFQEELSSQSDHSKGSPSESDAISHINMTPFNPSDTVNADVNLAFSDSTDLGNMQSEPKIAKQVLPMVIDASRTLTNLPVIVQTVEKADWHLSSHFQEKDTGIQPVIHTLTVDDDCVNSSSSCSLLPKNANLTMENNNSSIMDKSKMEDHRPVPAFSLDINDRDQMHYKYVMLVDNNSNTKKGC